MTDIRSGGRFRQPHRQMVKCRQAPAKKVKTQEDFLTTVSNKRSNIIATGQSKMAASSFPLPLFVLGYPSQTHSQTCHHSFQLATACIVPRTTARLCSHRHFFVTLAPSCAIQNGNSRGISRQGSTCTCRATLIFRVPADRNQCSRRPWRAYTLSRCNVWCHL